MSTVKPLLGERPWFGPRSLGWGWSPVSREGWASLGIALALALAVQVLSDGRVSDRGTAVVAGALVVTCIAKGTAPGGPAARRKFEETREDSAG